jgi:hypothetical protein
MAIGAVGFLCGCSSTSEKQSEAKRLESLRGSHPAAYEEERARSLNPATQDLDPSANRHPKN